MQNLTKNSQKCLLIHTKLYIDALFVQTMGHKAEESSNNHCVDAWVCCDNPSKYYHETGTCDRDTLEFVGYDHFWLISLNLEL